MFQDRGTNLFLLTFVGGIAFGFLLGFVFAAVFF